MKLNVNVFKWVTIRLLCKKNRATRSPISCGGAIGLQMLSSSLICISLTQDSKIVRHSGSRRRGRNASLEPIAFCPLSHPRAHSD